MTIKCKNIIHFKSQDASNWPSCVLPNHGMILRNVILEIMKYMCKVIRIQKLSGKKTSVGYDGYQQRHYS